MSGWITNLHIQIEDIQIYHIFKKKNYKNYTQGKFCAPQKLHLHFLHGKNQKRSKGQAKGKMCWYLTLTLHYSSLCTCKWNRYCISVMWGKPIQWKLQKRIWNFVWYFRGLWPKYSPFLTVWRYWGPWLGACPEQTGGYWAVIPPGWSVDSVTPALCHVSG